MVIQSVGGRKNGGKLKRRYFNFNVNLQRIDIQNQKICNSLLIKITNLLLLNQKLLSLGSAIMPSFIECLFVCEYDS